MKSLKGEGMKKKTEHFNGKATGYELKDGVYHIAPMYQETFDKLGVRRAAVDRLLQSVTDHCVELNMETEKASKVLWDSIRKDLDLDPAKQWTYRYSDGTIHEVKEEKK